MESVYTTLNGIQTNLLTWGNPFSSNGLDVIICITGNPGVPDFYIEFGSELHKTTGLPVCVIGQAGHVEVPDEKSNILMKHEHLFDLQGQVLHKLDLICNKIDKSCRLHLIGHSIGAWMIVESLQKQNELLGRVASINLLFPTLQKMAETKNGKHLNNIVRKFHFIAILLFTLVHLLPGFISQLLVSIYLKLNSLPQHYSERILKYLRPKVGEKVLYLAYDEMDRVVMLNHEGIDQIKHLTYVIYSDDDGWAPVTYIEDLKKYQPALKMKQVSIDHTFVLKSSEQVAELVSDFIKPHIMNK